MNTIQAFRLNPLDTASFKQKKKLSETNPPMNKLYLAETSVAAIGGISLLAYRNYANSYRVKLAKDLTKELGEKISAKHLKSIMSKTEMIKELSKLSEQNYKASAKNIKDGIFLADLHSHTNHSDGQISVEKLLNQASEYGNRLNKLNGKKFIFAISDHDGIEGVKEALKIIAKNPEKFKNVKFVPASEVSFVLPCQKNSVRFNKFHSDVQMPEMLVYNINPFSKTTKDFFERIYSSRRRQVADAVNEACRYYHTDDFSVLEYNKFFTRPNREYCFLNQHWRIWNYIHTKSRAVQMAKEQNQNPDILYETLIKELKQEHKPMTPYELDEYIKRKNIQTKSRMFDENLKPMLLEKIFPKKLGETVVKSDYEIQMSDLVKYAREEGAFLGFAHPGFTMQNFDKENCLIEMQSLIKQGKGRIKFAEKYHQAYPVGKEISESELKEYDAMLDKLKLINIGGRDNHTEGFIPNIC